MALTFVFILLFVGVFFRQKQSGSNANKFESFQDPVQGDFGLFDETMDTPCLVMRFNARLYNFNMNNTDLATEQVVDFTSSSIANLVGFCALHNEVRKQSQIQASWMSSDQRRKRLKLVFRENLIKPASHQAEELRWRLEKVDYSESFQGQSVKFSSVNQSQISAPLNQKFICKDRINITLVNSRYKNIVLELLPEIDLQPMNIHGFGFGSNAFTCEHTRRRTLRDSLQNRATIFSSVLLGTCSVGTLIGYSVWRHIRGTEFVGDQEPKFYGTF